MQVTSKPKPSSLADQFAGDTDALLRLLGDGAKTETPPSNAKRNSKGKTGAKTQTPPAPAKRNRKGKAPKRTSKENPVITARREAILAAAQQIRPLLEREAHGRHAIGQIVVSIENDQTKYGNGGVKQLAEVLGVDLTTLYDCARVAKTWTAAACKKLLQQTGKTGRRLSWSHLVEISHFKDAKARKKAVEDVLEHGLSVRQLKGKPAEEHDAEPAPGQKPAPAAARKTRNPVPGRGVETAAGDAVNGGATPPTEKDTDSSADTGGLAASLRAIVAHQQGFVAEGERCAEALKVTNATALAGNPRLAELLTKVRAALASKIRMAKDLDQQLKKLQPKPAQSQRLVR